MRKSKLGFTVMLVFFLASCGKIGFSSIENNPNNMRSDLEKSLEKGTTTLILINEHCSDCKRDKPVILREVKKLRRNGHNVLVYDVTKLSKKDFRFLVRSVPGVEYNNGIATPTFVELRSSSEHHFFTLVNVLRDKGTKEQINAFFERAGEN